jgi:oxygen-independent coproporphyrinogen-3 oxidase
MNRSHTAKQAQDCVQTAQKIGFNNITIDLIYGLPNATLADWEQNIEKALALDIQHISAYCLTVENKTLLHNQVKKGIVKLPSDESSLAQFKLLITKLEQQGFIQYEISNFGKSGYFSLHNSNYWKREKYLGIGPSAHSYSGKERRWNIANNAVYSKNLQNGESYFETEILSEANCINEYILTRLRTIWGIDIVEFENLFGKKAASTLQVQLDTWLAKNALLRNQNIYTLSLDGKFIADYIASELFVLE